MNTYNMDPVTGFPTLVSQQPALSGGWMEGLTVDPSGDYLYVLTTSDLQA